MKSNGKVILLYRKKHVLYITSLVVAVPRSQARSIPTLPSHGRPVQVRERTMVKSREHFPESPRGVTGLRYTADDPAVNSLKCGGGLSMWIFHCDRAQQITNNAVVHRAASRLHWRRYPHPMAVVEKQHECEKSSGKRGSHALGYHKCVSTVSKSYTTSIDTDGTLGAQEYKPTNE